MIKIAIDAGHGGFGVTAGKRTPAGEYEWNFNNKVVLSAIKYFKQYQGVSLLRLDDSTGKTDVPLITRTNKANAWGADILISVHHNANTGSWGEWTGTEIYTYLGIWPQAEKLASVVLRKLVQAYGLKDRGLKKADFHMLRESKMPAILIEGGYMDSSIDIKKMRDDKILDAAGKAIAEGVAEYLGMKKVINKPVSKPAVPTQNKPSSSYSGTSIVDYLKSIGMDSSKENRKKLAKQYGVSGYDFSSGKNLELLNKMRANKPASTPATPSKPAVKKQTVHLPAGANTWRTYKLGVQPVKKNSDWSLTPSKYGGLTYDILDRPYPNVVTIMTSRGKRNIYVGPETGAVIR
ncbi:N-acetylmuramoyl-L-alanine amidase [Bacillus norwichensis]|uniref:N-acetylmuramoyl-L-alanine amidase n=1 Tax=Bacillus norwichensis TaxID=2762217 RepID=A0ABR8VNA0_9BACI|nr:N-acetylmuramoyl-L-alanine amidase [Bacillus norwichensis]MBD8006222.1 N-acetylmuramoyl-L-alanine amidase [Bacillus norwichensis]